MMKQKKAVRNLIDPDFIEQGKTIGIIGGGQLGQMMALSAKYGGMKVITLDPTTVLVVRWLTSRLWLNIQTLRQLKSWLKRATY